MLDLDGLDGVRPDETAALPMVPRDARARVITPPPLPDDAPTGVDALPDADALPSVDMARIVAELVPPVPSLRPRTPIALVAAPLFVLGVAVVAWLVAARPPRAHVAVATPPAPPASRPIVTPLRPPVDAILPARFDFNERTPHGDAREIAAIVTRCDGAPILLTGHADALGSAAANDEIALARADAVRALLVERGVDGARVRIVSAGATQPIASNESARGRRDNRRVTLHCEPHNGGEP